MPLPCRKWNYRGTHWGVEGKNSAGFFQGSPVIRGRRLPSPGLPSETLDVRHFCSFDYTPQPPRGGTNASSCLRQQRNNLVAVRFFDPFNQCKAVEALRQSRNPRLARECLEREKERVYAARRILHQQKRQCLLSEWKYLRSKWEVREQSSDEMRDTPPPTPAPALVVRDVNSMGAADFESDEPRRQNKKSVLDTPPPATHATTPAPPSAPPIRRAKKPSVAPEKRRRILVLSCLRRNENPRMAPKEYRRPLDFYQDSIQSFLTVARPSTDELHILTNYYIPEWNSWLEHLRNKESIRREDLRAALRRSQINEHDDAAEHDGKFAARVVVQDSDSWQMKWDNWATEPPLSGRVWKIRHLVQEVMADEHDGTVSMMIFADARDVFYVTNPFDTIVALDLNRDRPRARRPDGLLRGVFSAAEDNSHQCNLARDDGTPRWEQTIISSDGVNRVLLDDRVLPDGQLLPIICSGYYGGSFEAMQDFAELNLRTLQCHDRSHGWGADQGGHNAAIYLGIAATAFPHDFFLLSNPGISPIRHMHYMDNDELTIFEPSDGSSLPVYVNCAGYAVNLHQLDRKIKRMERFKEDLKRLFDPQKRVPPAAADTADAA